MAPADVSALRSSGSSSRIKYEPATPFAPPKSISIPTSIPNRPPPAASSSTLLSSTPQGSIIAGGDAECYDSVRDMLCSTSRWESKQEEALLQPYTYLASRPGKGIRSQMIDAFNVWLKVPEDKLKVIHKVIGMLHTSSLLVDDVEDNSILRRGAPVAHAVYGIPQTINTANYVYFLVFAEVLAMNKGDSMKGVEEMIVEEMVNLHRGQGMDLYWRDNLVCPTESEYIEMVNNKTSGLLRIVIKLMIANSPVMNEGSSIDKDVLLPLVNLIGLLFQIRDDYMNLHSGDYAENKGYCEDLTEGKFSFPIIHSIRTSSSCQDHSRHGENGRSQKSSHRASMNGEALAIEDREHLLSILQNRPKEAKTKRIVVDYMETQTASFEYSRNVMTRLNRLVKAETTSLEKKLGGGNENKRLRGILGALSKGWIETSSQA